MIKYNDRVLETSTTQGTGAINLSGAVPGYQSFVDGVGNGAKVVYYIEDGVNWECGVGTVMAGTPATLSRDTVVESSNADNAVDWGAGVRNVFISASSLFMLWRDENLNDVNGIGASTGTGNAHIVTLTPTPLALSNDMLVRWRAPADNTGSVTVNVNSHGAKAYVNNDLEQFSNGMIKAGEIQEAIYNAAEGRFERTTLRTVISAHWNSILSLEDEEEILEALGLDGVQPVEKGGTGRDSHTPYALLCGGDEDTGAQQSVSGLGTAGQVLKSNGVGALPSWGTVDGVVVFISSEITVAHSGGSVQAHGLGGLPTGFRGYLKCITADGEYLPGDFVPYDSTNNTTNSTITNQFSAFMNATSVGCRIGNAGGIYMANKNTAGALAINFASWKYVLIAWK